MQIHFLWCVEFVDSTFIIGEISLYLNKLVALLNCCGVENNNYNKNHKGMISFLLAVWVFACPSEDISMLSQMYNNSIKFKLEKCSSMKY